MAKDLFSARQASQNEASSQDLLQYDCLPKAFRIQVNHLLKGAIGKYAMGIHLGGILVYRSRTAGGTPCTRNSSGKRACPG